jgi:hypothetical protein
MRLAGALPAFFAVIAIGPCALAAASDEWATGAGASVQFAGKASERSAFWEGQVEYGLNETLHAGLELGAAHALDDFSLRALRATPLVGVRLDVVEWVPYLASGPSLLVGLQGKTAVDLGADVVVGLDYLLSRSWAVGAQYHFTATAADGGTLVHRAGLRLMYLWGW